MSEWARVRAGERGTRERSWRGISHRLRSRVRTGLALVIAVTVVVPVTVTAAAPAEAASASLFDPGFLISDAAFFDSGSMTVAQVQGFLDAKVPTCHATTGPTCLKGYREDTRAVAAAPEPDTCGPLSARTGRTAAQIIVDIATACGISPRALLVLLEKEQGLVSSTAPSTRNYTFATGWGCPDTADCQRLHTGLFNQLYKGAWQLKWYGRGSFTWIKLGQPNFVRYHPNAACGGEEIVIRNRATAALYYYTPYQPNGAAMANMYGVGDSCSAYGNRNFWRMYSDWFGSPIGGDTFFRTASSSVVYLVAGDVKYRVGAAPTLTDLSMLGKVNTVSQSYLDRFRSAGALKPIVHDPAKGTYWLLDQGKKLPVAACATAHDYALTCGGASKVTTSQLDRMATGAAVTGRVKTPTGHSWYIADGVRREFYDTAAYTASGFPAQKLIYLADRTVAHIPVGPPALPDLKTVTDDRREEVAVSVGGAAWTIPAALFAELGLSSTFGEPRTLHPASFSAIPAGGRLTDFVRAETTGEVFVLTPGGRVPFPHADPAAATAVPDTLLDAIPVAAGDWASKYVVDLPNDRRYLVDGAAAYRVRDDVELQALTRAFGLPEPVRFPIVAIQSIPHDTYMLAPGSTARSADGKLWYVDGQSTLHPISAKAADELATRKPLTVDAATFARYTKSPDPLAIGVGCAGGQWVANDGRYHPVDPKVARAYPFAFPSLAPETCAALTTSSATAGRFLRDAATRQLYYIWGGTKRPITGSTYWRLRAGTGHTYLTVGASFLSHFRTGSPLR